MPRFTRRGTLIERSSEFDLFNNDGRQLIAAKEEAEERNGIADVRLSSAAIFNKLEDHLVRFHLVQNCLCLFSATEKHLHLVIDSMHIRFSVSSSSKRFRANTSVFDIKSTPDSSSEKYTETFQKFVDEFASDHELHIYQRKGHIMLQRNFPLCFVEHRESYADFEELLNEFLLCASQCQQDFDVKPEQSRPNSFGNLWKRAQRKTAACLRTSGRK